MEAETYGLDPNVPLVTPMLVPSIKVKILRHALEIEAKTSVADDNSTLQIDFSKMELSEVYEI